MNEISEQETGKTICQSYKLTAARQDFGLYGQRALLRVIEGVQAEMQGLSFKDGRDIRKIPTVETNLWGDKIMTLDLRTICSEGVNKFEPVRKALLDLMKITFEYEDDETWEALSFINKTKVNKGSWFAELTISADMWKALMDFSKGFRIIEIETAMKFKSQYTLRIYQLLAGQEYPLTYNIEELKKMFQVENKYKRTLDFLKRVIDVAKKELDIISPYTFEYTLHYNATNGRGRPSISSITFNPVHNITKHAGQNEVKGKLDLRAFIGKEAFEILTRKFEIPVRSINNNFALFKTAKENLDLPEFLRQIAPYALRAKSTAAYTVKAIKKELEVKAGIRFVKPTKIK